MKEKDYTITVNVHVTKQAVPNAVRHYEIEIFCNPISNNPVPFKVEVATMPAKQTQKVGQALLDAIWKMTDGVDKNFWEG
jgi:hypothetical protein